MKVKTIELKAFCQCGHIFFDHDFEVKEGLIFSGPCKMNDCDCTEFLLIDIEQSQKPEMAAHACVN